MQNKHKYTCMRSYIADTKCMLNYIADDMQEPAAFSV